MESKARARIVQAYRRDGKPAGLYRVPANVSDEEFRKEFFRFDHPSRFDKENFLGVTRIRKPIKQASGLWYPRWKTN